MGRLGGDGVGRHYWQLPDGETQVNLVREARASALVIVLCDVLLDVPVAELPGARRSWARVLEGVEVSQFLKRISLARGEIEDFDVYPFSLPLVRSMDTVELNPRVTFFVGANGSGKSTLLEAMAVALGFNAEGGSRHFNFTTRPSHSKLHDYLRIARGTCKPHTGYFLRAESFFNVATEIDHLGSRSSTQPMVAVRYTSNPTASHF